MRFIFMDKATNRVSLWCLLIGVFIIIGILSAPGCKSSIPPIDVSFWAGDSAKDGVSRSQENKTISCNDPAIDDMTCLSYADLKKIYSVMLQCQQWPSSATLEKPEVVFRRFNKKNPEVVNHVFTKKPTEPVWN